MVEYGEVGVVGGCGTLGRPRASEFGQEAERACANLGTSAVPLSL